MKMNERICDCCGKNPATVHFKKTVNGKSSESYLCAECASKNGEVSEISAGSGAFDGFSGFDSLFGKLFFDTPFIGGTTTKKSCPTCHFTLDDISENSRLGCPDCYEVFEEELNIKSPYPNGYRGRRPALVREDGKPVKTVSGDDKKNTAKQDDADELTTLRAELEKALADENYELCAKLRDKIKAKGGENK